MRLGNKIVKILRVELDNFRVTLRYQDGATMTVSLSRIFDTARGLAAEVLRGGIFARCFVESGALAWPNGFELCPDALRLWAGEQASPHKRSKRGAA